MEAKEFDALVEKIGKEAATKIKAEFDAHEQKYKDLLQAYKSGDLSPEKMKEYQDSVKTSIDEIKEIAEKQGTTINELQAKINTGEVGVKSISQQLKDDEGELRKIHANGSGVKYYMISINAKGQYVMKPYDMTKAAGPHATVGDVGGIGNLPAVTQNFNAASILRMGADAPIMAAYRNNPWVFGLCNLINVGMEQSFAIWFDEQAKQGSSANVAEGATKPLVQYAYQLKSAEYKKEAMLVSFTQEFTLDFQKLQSEILRVSQIDLVNNINARILPNIVAAATPYNTGDAYKAAGDPIANPNDWDALAAMAAQVENATFAAAANTAVMSTNKKYRMGTVKDSQGRWLNPPDVLAGLSTISNPAMGADDVLVGDLKQYNIMLRGGLILRVGYNGTDFAENKFSTVLEQFYFDYISTARKPAIVKGPDYATVKAAIAA